MGGAEDQPDSLAVVGVAQLIVDGVDVLGDVDEVQDVWVLGDRERCLACDVAERDLIAGGRGAVAQVELEVDLALGAGGATNGSRSSWRRTILYWSIGRAILAEQERHAWGDDVVGLLAQDLRATGDLGRGFSRRNLFYMRRFAALWPDEQKVPPLAAQIGWTLHRVLLDAFGDDPDL